MFDGEETGAYPAIYIAIGGGKGWAWKPSPRNQTLPLLGVTLRRIANHAVI